MKDKYFVIVFTALLLALISFSCDSDFALPESVAVKSDAEFNVPFGSMKMDLGDKMDLSSILRSSFGATANVYEYVPDANDDTMKFLLQKNIFEVPVNVGDYFQNMDLDSMLNSTDGFSFEQEISLPAVNQEIAIDIDPSTIVSVVEDDMLKSLNENKSPVNIRESSETRSILAVTVGSNFSKGLGYKQGAALIVKVTKTDSTPCGSGYEFKIKASIPSYNTSIGGSAKSFGGTTSGVVDVTNGGVLELPLHDSLGDNILPSTFEINFDGTTSGNNSSVFHKYSFEFSLKQGTTFSGIYEIDTTKGNEDASDDLVIPDFNIPDTKFSFSSSAAVIKTATIGTGGIDIDVNVPSTWRGVNLVWKSFDLTGAGISKSEADFTDAGSTVTAKKQKLNLENATLDFSKGNELSISGKMSIDVNGATILLGSDNSVKGKVKVCIKTISAATADLSAVGGTAFKLDENSESPVQLPSSVRQFVKKISFGQLISGTYYRSDADGNPNSTPSKGVGIKCKTINSLPAGNDIPLIIKSNMFNLDFDETNKGAELVSTGSTTEKDVSFVNYKEIIFDTTNPNCNVTSDYVDISVGVPNNITLVNLEMGKSYRIGIKDVEFVMDYDSVEIDLTAAAGATNFKDEMDLSVLDVSSLLGGFGEDLNELVDAIKIKELPVYFFAQQPKDSSILGDVSMEGNVYLSYKEKSADGSSSTDKTENLLGIKDSSKDTLNFVSPVSWPDAEQITEINASNGKNIIDVLEASDSAGRYSFKVDFAEFLTKKLSEFKLNYDIAVEGGTSKTIYKAQMYSLDTDSSASLSIGFALVLPLEFEVTKPAGIDVLKFMGMETPSDGSTADMLQRTEVSTTEQYSSYVDSLEYFKMKYSIHNNIIKGLNVSIILDDTHSGEANLSEYSGIRKTIPLTSANEFKFTSDDVKSVLTHYFYPSVKVQLNPGIITASRSGFKNDGNVGVTPVFSLKVDSDKPIKISDVLGGSK